MDSPYICSLILLLASVDLASAQGTLLFDQQSSTDGTPFPASGRIIQQYLPLGQSFTPSLAGVGFVNFKLYDNDTGNGLGATLYVNLRAGSITGAILGTSTAISLTNGFAGVVSFDFQSEIPVVPGAAYVFEPVVQSRDSWKIDLGEYGYPGGTTISQGLSLPGSDLWFREGVVTVPEPSSAALLSMAAALALHRGRKRFDAKKRS